MSAFGFKIQRQLAGKISLIVEEWAQGLSFRGNGKTRAERVGVKMSRESNLITKSGCEDEKYYKLKLWAVSKLEKTRTQYPLSLQEGRCF